MTSDPIQIHPIRTRTHRESGLPYAQLARQRDSGQIVRLRTGLFLASGEWNALGPTNRHRILVSETLPLLKSDAVASHRSSAAVLGIPCLGSPPAVVHVTDVRRGGQSSAHVRHHRARRRPPVVVVDGVVCTTPARTAIDLARTLAFDSALIAMDHVLHGGLATREEIAAEISELGRVHGIRRAAVVFAHASGLAESPGESLSRARMIQLGVRLPELQHAFRDERGLIGRSDFWWDAERLAGEFDGAMKYGVGEGGLAVDAKEVVYREKVREDRIRALDVKVARWGWDDTISLPKFVGVMTRAGLLAGPADVKPEYSYPGRE